MNELHTVFDITVGSNGIGDDAWFRMAIGIGAAIAGMVWVMRVWRMQAGWRQMFNAVSLIGFGAIWLIVTLPLWNLATSDTDRLLLIQLSGQSEVTEGAVHVTHMQPLHGHCAERCAYNEGQSDLQVRIHDAFLSVGFHRASETA